MKYTTTQHGFLKDVSSHAMTILRDDGVYRHLRFKRPDSGVYWFDLVTWPGRLSISGDMGDYTFARLNDMFEFFRTDRESAKGLRINLGYWSEKVVSACPRGKVTEFCPDLFRKAVIEDFRQWRRSAGLRVIPDMKQHVRDFVLDYANDSEHEALRSVHEFSNEGQTPFDCFWDRRLHDYTNQFRWICYAIAWGIQQYDNSKQEKTSEAA